MYGWYDILKYEFYGFSKEDIIVKKQRMLILSIVLLTSLLLTSCEAVDKTPSHLDNDYQSAYEEGYAAAMAELSQNKEAENESEEDNNAEPINSEEAVASQPSSDSNNGNISTVQTQPDTQDDGRGEEQNATVPDIVSVIAAMQATAPLIDTKTITVYDDEGWASDIIYVSGDHIGEYNGIQVDDMFNLDSDAYNEKYYTVTDDLINVENTLRNAEGKTWLELGYTNCIPAIRYDLKQNRYEENPYDMVHPGWQHTYAVMYSCVWSDGTPRYGVYYIRVSNDTDQEMMAILCPIYSVSDGMNLW